MRNKNHLSTRRDLLRGTIATAATAGMGRAVQAGVTAGKPISVAENTLRDRFWIWTHPGGVYGTDFGLKRTSRMTPVEGAVYLGVRNLYFIRYHSNPAMPFDQYAISFRPMKRVVWSLVGASGKSDDAEREHVFDLAAKYPNIGAFIMDDYFHKDGAGSLTDEQLKALRERLVIGGQKRDLVVVVYKHQLHLPIQKQLDYCDEITFWTWKSPDLKDLEKNFDRLEKLAPRHGKLLGCYLWDFGTRKPMPLELMKKQCELGRKWLEQGRIEGMIFLGSNVCDLELESVEWTRQWIADVGGQRLSSTIADQA